jgi:hypothetical protein
VESEGGRLKAADEVLNDDPSIVILVENGCDGESKLVDEHSNEAEEG